ncbi:hypothetical protein [Methylobacterium sp. WSM2598]|uniref:hypothetical protein n=1 Tax=Methylobacterium sp. WSM2598 TaxID=398261 RepID=UPI000476B0FB|nr:hypothetical protein [Methylobacterium sp. WSM2598]
MTTPKVLPLGRAPRPRASAEELARLAEGGAEAGFARPLAAEAPASPSTPPAAGVPAAPPAEAAAEPTAPLRLEVPESVWTALRMEAVRRKVTVKFLVIEALAAKGYGIDLASVPEDGRRRQRR